MNLTSLLIAVCLFIALVSRDSRKALDSIRWLLNRRTLVALLAVGATAQSLLALYKGYVVPRDVMQDLISAREYLSGRSPYPSNMTALFMEWVESDPPSFSLMARWPNLKANEDEARSEAANSHWVQAHPPVMTLLVSPLVGAFGYRGAYFAITAISLVCLVLTLRWIALGLGFRPTWREAAAIGFAILGWASTLTVVRNGQTGLILECLLVFGLYGLKRGRPIASGIAVALAASIKLYPGLELAYLWGRHRLAFFTSLAIIAFIVLGSASLCGWHSFAEHAATAREVVARYGDYPTNNSLLGVLVRTIRWLGGTDLQARFAYVSIAATLVIGCVWLTRPRANEREQAPAPELGYSLFMALIPLLSPVSWDHYLVILILPLAVVAKQVMAQDASRWSLPALLAIFLIFATPENGFSALSGMLQPTLGARLADVIVMALPALTICMLAGWLAVLVSRRAGGERLSC